MHHPYISIDSQRNFLDETDIELGDWRKQTHPQSKPRLSVEGLDRTKCLSEGELAIAVLDLWLQAMVFS